MLTKRVIPCLDVRGGRVTKGVRFKNNVDLGDPVEMAVAYSEGGADLLGVLPGKVRRFPNVPGCKVPEIGWNQVKGLGVEGVADGSEFYFVHSYYAEKGAYTAGVTEYAGIEFTSAVRKGNLFATQFHPEKSGRIGLSLLSSFLTF